MKFCSLFVVSISLLLSIGALGEEIFNEEVIAHPLPTLNSRLVAFQMRFQMISNQTFKPQQQDEDDDFKVIEYGGIFPKAVAEIVERFQVEELRITLAKGRWLSNTWGNALQDSEAPQGAELWAWFKSSIKDENEVSQLWDGLRNALSGLLCASLSSLGDELTSKPGNDVLFGVSRGWNTHNLTAKANARHGTMPGETVCTENLTPWMRLLPCRDKSGIGVLLNPLKLYGTPYHAMTLHYFETSQSTRQLIQSLTVVLDNQQSKKPFSIESAFAPLPKQTNRKDSLTNGISACPLATESVLRISNLKSEKAKDSIVSPSSISHGIFEQSSSSMKYKLLPNQPIHVEIGPNAFPEQPKELGSILNLSAHRVLTGHGQKSGGILTKIKNEQTVSSSSSSSSLVVTLFQSFPFFIRPYFSTLTLFINGTKIDHNENSEFIEWIHVNPGGDSSDYHPSPANLEVQANLPSQTELVINLEFETVFLHISKHPPDANRGRDLPSGVIIINTDDSNHQNIRVQYTEGLLISLPTPDFSMPYNVITLTCTAVALFYGSVLTLATRHWKTVFDEQSKEFNTDRPIVRIAKFIIRTIRRFIPSKPQASTS